MQIASSMDLATDVGIVGTVLQVPRVLELLYLTMPTVDALRYDYTVDALPYA